MRFRVLSPSGAYVHERLYEKGEIFEIEDDDPRLKDYRASVRKPWPSIEVVPDAQEPEYIESRSPLTTRGDRGEEAMDGKRFIRTIKLDNILSYGSWADEFPLEPLNVLIGPNASGKSNLIEAISLLAAAPRDIQGPIQKGGGVLDWLWKGASGLTTATVDITVEYPKGHQPLRYLLSFTETGARFTLKDEVIANEKPYDDKPIPYLYYDYKEGYPVLNVSPKKGANVIIAV